MLPHAIKAAEFTGTDLGITGMWAWLENNFDTFSENCSGSDANPNTPCYQWGYNWQVGYGLHVANSLHSLKDAMRLMHPNDSVQSVGQAVINASLSRSRAITYPETTFPNFSLDTLIQGANNGDNKMRARVATLMKDDAIGTYLVAQRFKELGINSTLATRMQNWPPAGYYDKQKLLNTISADSGRRPVLHSSCKRAVYA